MRYLEIASGVRSVVNAEEQDVINNSVDGVIRGIKRDDLRTKEVIRSMISKGLLTLIKVDDKPVVAVNSINHIWRGKNDR